MPTVPLGLDRARVRHESIPFSRVVHSRPPNSARVAVGVRSHAGRPGTIPRAAPSELGSRRGSHEPWSTHDRRRLSPPHGAREASASVGQCVACCRPYGLPRSPAAEPSGSLALLGCPSLVVCDPCWHLAGGRRGVAARVLDVDEASAATDAATAVAPVLVFDPAVAALLEDAGRYDELHPIDRILVESGVRWALVRRIVVPSRMKLAGDVLCRVPQLLLVRRTRRTCGSTRSRSG